MQEPAVPIYGQSILRGPVVLVWDAVLRGALHPERGHNVVYHEFAHKLDMLDGCINGTPPLAERAQYERWIAVCTREYNVLRRCASKGSSAQIAAHVNASSGAFDRDVAMNILDVLGIARNRHCLIRRSAGAGGTGQPYDAVLVGVDMDTLQAGNVLRSKFGLNVGCDRRLLHEFYCTCTVGG
jgi:hypothetical protein